MDAVSAGGAGGRPERAKAQPPQEGTRSNHAASSLAALKTQPSGARVHRVLPLPARFESRTVRGRNSRHGRR